MNSYEDLLLLKSLKDSLDFYEIEVSSLYIPCLIHQQFDRRFENSLEISFKMETVSFIINSCNFKKVFIFEPHSDVSLGMIKNYVGVSPFTELKNLTKNHNPETTILMSPYAGAYKKVMKLANKINWEGEVVSASKYRNSEGIISTYIDKQDFENKDVMIVGDLCIKMAAHFHN